MTSLSQVQRDVFPPHDDVPKLPTFTESVVVGTSQLLLDEVSVYLYGWWSFGLGGSCTSLLSVSTKLSTVRLLNQLNTRIHSDVLY